MQSVWLFNIANVIAYNAAGQSISHAHRPPVAGPRCKCPVAPGARFLRNSQNRKNKSAPAPTNPARLHTMCARLSWAMKMAAPDKELASMASPDKQQKRAQRAKTKAKQNRMGKPKANLIHPVLANPMIDEPFDDVEIDLSTFDFKDIEENGFDPAHFDDLFQAMKAGEGISLLAMCLVFLQYPVLELVVAEEAEDAATDFMMGLLITYRGIFHDDDEDAAVKWIGSEAFQAAYNEASLILQKKTARERVRTQGQ